MATTSSIVQSHLTPGKLIASDNDKTLLKQCIIGTNYDPVAAFELLLVKPGLFGWTECSGADEIIKLNESILNADSGTDDTLVRMLTHHMRFMFRCDEMSKVPAWYMRHDRAWIQVRPAKIVPFARFVIRYYLRKLHIEDPKQQSSIVRSCLKVSKVMENLIARVGQEEGVSVQGIRTLFKGKAFHMRFSNGVFDVLSGAEVTDAEIVESWIRDNGSTFDEKLLQSQLVAAIKLRVKSMVGNDEDSYKALCNCIGYLCSGTKMIERSWFWLVGEPGSGKTTLLNMIKLYLGYLCAKPEHRLVSSNNDESEKLETAKLAGCWAFMLDELKTAQNASGKLRTVFTTALKRTTNGTMKARLAGLEEFEIERTWAGSIVAFNGRIKPSKSDTGYLDVIRRVVVVPCVTVPETHRTTLDLEVPGSDNSNAACMFIVECVRQFHAASKDSPDKLFTSRSEGGCIPESWIAARDEIIYDEEVEKAKAADAKSVEKVMKNRNLIKEAYDTVFEKGGPTDTVKMDDVQNVVIAYLAKHDLVVSSVSNKTICCKLRDAGIPIESSTQSTLRRATRTIDGERVRINLINYTKYKPGMNPNEGKEESGLGTTAKRMYGEEEVASVDRTLTTVANTVQTSPDALPVEAAASQSLSLHMTQSTQQVSSQPLAMSVNLTSLGGVLASEEQIPRHTVTAQREGIAESEDQLPKGGYVSFLMEGEPVPDSLVESIVPVTDPALVSDVTAAQLAMCSPNTGLEVGKRVREDAPGSATKRPRKECAVHGPYYTIKCMPCDGVRISPIRKSRD